MSKVVGVICCGGNVYEYEGWTFEIHYWNGPWPLKKDGDPREHAGKVFWDVWERFDKLSDDEKKTCLVLEGGCYPLVIGSDDDSSQ